MNARRIARACSRWKMEDVQHCCVCLELYNLRSRTPLLLPCRHTLCALCSKQPLLACPLCRQQINSNDTPFPVDQQLLTAISSSLRNKMPSPSSYPIGLLEDSHVDDAPGTPPHPSAPALLEPCITSDAGSSRRTTASSLHRSSASTSSSSSGSSVDLQDPSSAGFAAPAVTDRALITRNNSTSGRRAKQTKQGARSIQAGWGASPDTAAAGDPGSSMLRLTRNTMSSAASTSSQQALSSFPVEDLEAYQEDHVTNVRNLGLPNPQPGSPRSWPMHDEELSAPAAAAGAGSSGNHASTSAAHGTSCRVGRAGSGGSRMRNGGVYASTQAAAQAVAAGVVCVLQQLTVPWGGLLDHEDVRNNQGRPANSTLPRSSVVVAAVHSSIYCWASYSAALQRSLRTCQTAQQRTQAIMERLLQQVGLPGYGQLAWYWAATLVLGALLYHWQLGLQLLPVAAASLALSAVAGMRPLNSSSSRDSSMHEAAGSSSDYRSHRVDDSSSSSSGSSSLALPVWPSQAAGGLLAADCFMLGALLCISQQTGLGSGPLSTLLAATPRLLAVVALLLCGQVVVDVLCRGWWGHMELRHASLLCRCWVVAAVGVLSAGGAGASLTGTLAAAAAWAQKAHMLLVEGPVFVLCLASLLQPLSGQAAVLRPEQQQEQQEEERATPSATGSRSRPGASSSSRGFTAADQSPTAAANAATRAGSTAVTSSTGGTPALLCCLHFLLQLLVLLFVPPGPLASAFWLPQPLQGLLVWGARVLLCGAAVQLALRAFNSPSGTAAGGAAGHAAGAAAANAQVPWASPSAPALCSSSVGNAHCGSSTPRGTSSSCGTRGLTTCQQQFSANGGTTPSCCSSPSPRARKGWELQLHGQNSPSHHSSGCGGSGSRGLCGTDMGCGGQTPSHGNCSSWALAGCNAADNDWPPGRSGPLGLNVGTGLAAGSSAIAVAVYRLLWQHAAYLLLLAAAIAGDTFITAAAPASATSASMLAPTDGVAAAGAAAAAGLAIRVAWQRCVQYCMVVGLCVEVLLAARRELLLLLRLPLFPGTGAAASSFGGGVFTAAGWQQRPAAATW